jgi:hypothetical protein
MADLLTFGQAVQRASVSRQRLNRAIHNGRFPAECCGGPGKPTRIRFEDAQAWCASERFSLPVKVTERLERSSSDLVRLEAQQALASLMGPYIERFERSITHAIEQAIDHVVERLSERLARQLAGHPERSEERSSPAPAIIASTRTPKEELLQRLRYLQAEGLSLQKIADRLNTEGLPTLSGK